ncbi:unnamed protein product [Brassica oleracea]
MKAAVYALLCFLFIVSGHIQEVEANLMKQCNIGYRMPGNCAELAQTCEKFCSRGKEKKPSHWKCTNGPKNTYSCDCK